MHHRRYFLPFYIILPVLVIIFVIIQQNILIDLTGTVQNILSPVQRFSYTFLHPVDRSETKKLKDENLALQSQLVKLKTLENDNRALRDQFTQSSIPHEQLLPAYIVGMPVFLPGISPVEKITIDKGTEDKVKTGDKVVYKDNLVGIVHKTSPHISEVRLLTHQEISFTARTLKTSASGILKGAGNNKMILTNVLLSDNLQKGDLVMTGDSPYLAAGKIISVNKKASALFQSAEAESMIDISGMHIVFIKL